MMFYENHGRNIFSEITTRKGVNVKIRKAEEGDLGEVYNLACSSCYKEDEHTERLLYPIEHYKDGIKNSENFYVAETEKILGFLTAYEKEKWLDIHPNWANDILWHPQLNNNTKDNFLMIEELVVSDEGFEIGLKEAMYDFIINKSRTKNIPYVFKEVIVSPIPNISSLAIKNEKDFILSGIKYIKRNDQVYTNLVFCKPTTE